MKKYLIQYKAFLLFLAKFLFSYLILTFLYKAYLNQYHTGLSTLDGFTETVAQQSRQLLMFLDDKASIVLENYPTQVMFSYNNSFTVRIIEGCNAVSIVVLFISFVIAFTGKLKHTIIFLAGGSLLIHLLNIVRIALFVLLAARFPQYLALLHDIAFPLVIYGFVFVLWIVWVNKFSLNTKRNANA